MSLLELIAVMAILAVVSCLSVPGFFSLQQALRMNNALSSLVSAVHFARQESRASGTSISLCRSRNSIQCDDTAGWQTGWLVFRNLDEDEPPRVDPGEAVLLQQGAVAGAEIRANRDGFTLRPGTERSTNGTFIYCDTRGQRGAVVVSYTGKARREQRTGPCIL